MSNVSVSRAASFVAGTTGTPIRKFPFELRTLDAVSAWFMQPQPLGEFRRGNFAPLSTRTQK
jgi:hypothetical protein